MKIAIGILGAVCVLLGGLWLVQGLGLVNIPPIFCVVKCEPISGFSTGWAIAGIVLALLGVAVIYFALHWRAMRD
jgi:hypothetical protein